MIRAIATCVIAVLVPPSVTWSCTKDTFDGQSFTMCSISLATEDLRLFLRDDQGAPYGSFAAIEAALGPLAFAMNAGMYHEDRAPVGLYVEAGVQETRLLTGASDGNFGMLPNGVFCISQNRATVVETLQFAALDIACDYASQSGPMLVINGALHPRFLPDSTSFNIRNGVGVTGDGRVAVFVISDEAVTFDAFGRYFRDHLRVENALYFDGRISRLHAPDLGRSDAGARMGPIVGVLAQ